MGTRRKILDQSALHDRAEEEMLLLKTEMRRCYFHFCNLHAYLAEFLAQIDRSTAHGAGLHCISMQSILWLEARLTFMWKKISPYTGVNTPEPPESYVINLSVHNMQKADECDTDTDNDDCLSETDSSCDDESETYSENEEEVSDVEVVFDE